MSKPDYKNIGTYLAEDHHSNVKESFKVLADMIEKNIVSELSDASRESISVLDVGCATGALVDYLSRRFTGWRYTGIDVSDKLLTIAKHRMPQHAWRQGSALELPLENTAKYDVSLLIGVLGIFDENDARRVLDELVRYTKKGGLIYVFAQFSEFDVDVAITHRKYHGDDVGEWEKGWNIYSMKTIRSWLEERVTDVHFIDFNLPALPQIRWVG